MTYGNVTINVEQSTTMVESVVH